MTIRAPRRFNEAARRALADPVLQAALKRFEQGMAAKRSGSLKGFSEFAMLREEARAIKDHVLENLDWYLERFAENVRASGGHVHFCETTEQARRCVLRICREVAATSVTKGKSMISEELALNEFLAREGISPVETDLGEYIVQLANEPPSHIIGPAIHKTRTQIGALFHRHHAPLGHTQILEKGEDMVAEARDVLREHFLRADVGITGANFLIAETGSTVIVTNEGNGDLTQTLPKTHIVVASIEKLLPTLEDCATLLRVLARSATGQEMSVYTTISTGPRRSGDHDGPEAFHVVLIDNGRSNLLGSALQPILRCIRCGACMNVCPVYGTVGGHSYGAVYMGPMGAALAPALMGVEKAHTLAEASTLCGRCEEVCPVRIPLPQLLRLWRARAYEATCQGWRERFILALWTYAARHPRFYRALVAAGLRLAHIFGGRRGRLRHVPFFSGWTSVRDLPLPQASESFVQLWQKKRAAGKQVEDR
jgi:L-lactate dehydrogenase complex protein LldF